MGDGENDESDSDASEIDSTEHGKSLMKLKDIDPEFYQYLEQNDTNLLDFKLSDEEDDEEETPRHVPDENLEVCYFQ